MTLQPRLLALASSFFALAAALAIQTGCSTTPTISNLADDQPTAADAQDDTASEDWARNDWVDDSADDSADQPPIEVDIFKLRTQATEPAPHAPPPESTSTVDSSNPWIQPADEPTVSLQDPTSPQAESAPQADVTPQTNPTAAAVDHAVDQPQDTAPSDDLDNIFDTPSQTTDALQPTDQGLDQPTHGPPQPLADEPQPPSEEPPLETQEPVIPPGTPSLVGLDRSHWPEVVTGPADGSTSHYTTYHHDRSLTNTDGYPAGAATADHEQRLQWALDGTEAAGWSGTNATALIAQPVKFAVDTAMMPIRLVTQPPFRPAASP